MQAAQHHRGEAGGLLALVNATTKSLDCLWNRSTEYSQDYKKAYLTFKVCMGDCNHQTSVDADITYDTKREYGTDIDTVHTGGLVSLNTFDDDGTREKDYYPWNR